MQKILNFFKKLVTAVKGTFNDNGNFCLHRSLILIFVLSAWTVIYQMVAQSFNLLQLYGPILILNIIPIFLLMTLLYFVIGKISYSFVVTNTVLSVLLLVNHYKIKFRDEPLIPSDFSLGKEAGNIIKNYDIKVDGIVIVVIAVCAVSFWFVLKNIRNKRPNLLISAVGIVVTAALSVCAYGLIYKNTRIYSALLSDLGIYHESTVVSSKGLVYSLINSTTVMKYNKPEGYSKEAADEILNRYPDNKLPTDAPNIIAVMCESYTDVQDWENIEFSGENPYNFINSLRQSACYGEILVPGFGGGTAATEFEFLTGNNTSAISPSMPTAYKTLITAPAYSIVRHFKEAGFEANAMHPGDGWFYNRQNVYPKLGFDSFTTRADLENSGVEIKCSHGSYADDTVSANMIIDDFKKHLEKNDGSGYFNFTVTIQNHGPYSPSELIYGDEYVAKSSELTDEEYYIINNYLGGIKAADEFLQTIYDFINTVDEPTVLVFFGDHLPSLDEDEKIYEKLGFNISDESAKAYENRYSTDYIIIGNDAFLRKTTPQLTGRQELVSANYLPVKLFKYLNTPLPQFEAFLDDMMQFAPIISKAHDGASGTLDSTMDESQKNMINEYKILQYRNIKDYKAEKGENQ